MQKAFVLSSVLYFCLSIMHSSGIIFIIIFQLTQILYNLEYVQFCCKVLNILLSFLKSARVWTMENCYLVVV